MKHNIKTTLKITCLLCASLVSSLSLADNHNEDKQLKKAFRYLSSHDKLSRQVAVISKWSRKSVKAGPLIANGDNNGIINIDTPLNPYLPINVGVCGEENPSPSIREAVLCTVQDNLGGNTQANHVGYSTHGRTLLGAQLGNPAGTRVMIITQQHGNEPAGTEAAMRVLWWLSFSNRKPVREILDKLNILMLIRTNPDGGEPNLDECATNLATGEVITKDCAMMRQNVDAHAGGGFLANTEDGFNGVVGQGYDLNRYHFVNLQAPIRPVETQAMVATALAFMPEVVLDLHGDLHKTDCQIDFTSINPGQVLGQLPTAECYAPDMKADQRLISPFADAVFNQEKEYLVQSLAVNIMNKVNSRFEGSVGRFSQLLLGENDLSAGAASNYQRIGAASSGWETINFGEAVRADVVAFNNFTPVIAVNSGLPDPAVLKKQIRINKIALVEALKSLADFKDNAPTDGNGFCDFPLASGLQAELEPEMWGPLATEGKVTIPMSPLLGVPLIVSGNCP